MAHQIQLLLSLSLSLFIVLNAFGNIPLFLSLLKGIPRKRQKQIVFRELLIALFIIIIFTDAGASKTVNYILICNCYSFI